MLKVLRNTLRAMFDELRDTRALRIPADGSLRGPVGHRGKVSWHETGNQVGGQRGGC
jgi:hypothetical protein